MQPGEHKRKPNGILGLLCRLHFPGLVMHAGVLEPAYTWDHYMASPDATDREGRNFTTKARRVVGELWVSHPRTKMVDILHSVSIFGMMIAIILWVYMQDFYMSEEGYEARANEQAHQACYKLVKDLHYEVRVQAVVVYCTEFEKRIVKKPATRDIFLTRDQYLRVNKCHLYSFILYLILQYVMHFITFRCLRTGAQTRPSAGL